MGFMMDPKNFDVPKTSPASLTMHLPRDILDLDPALFAPEDVEDYLVYFTSIIGIIHCYVEAAFGV
jgi:hypothetical protein